jgi:50S ribosomal protein L16 3-hydroxylase
MLYLPPQLAHWGIAVSDGKNDCMTYSIGFRAPKNQELATEFLGYMQDQLNQEHLTIAGMYEDADLSLQDHAAEISTGMVTQVAEILKKIQWSNNDVADFLGSYLSEPKPDVVFDVNKKISLSNFKKNLAKYGISLDLKSQMLFTGNTFYLNGEAVTFTGESAKILIKLADQRALSADDLNNSHTLNETLLNQLLDWYLAGFLHLNA